MNAKFLEPVVFKYKTLLNRGSNYGVRISPETLCVELRHLIVLERNVGIISLNYRTELSMHVDRLRKVLFKLCENEISYKGMTGVLYEMASCMNTRSLCQLINRMYLNLALDIGVRVIGSHGKIRDESMNHNV